MYIDRKQKDLAGRPGVLEIHTIHKCQDAIQSLRAHVSKRVDASYPPATHGTEKGGLLPGLADLLKTDDQLTENPTNESGFEFKQSTMHDNARSLETLFDGVRPSLVVAERETAGTLKPEEEVLSSLDKVLDMPIPMGKEFEDQWNSQYLPRIFPWALNYDCGGADYPGLFEDWEQINVDDRQTKLIKGVCERWRRRHKEAKLLPHDYAKMLSTRPEMQVAGDWTLVPAARNLCWRYSVLHSAFMVCKQKVSPGKDSTQNLEELVEGARRIFKRIAANTVVIQGE